uniref:30 kDa salivary gland allergen Aegyptin-2 n=1 Tax=Culex tarsalis TaxID=7177 RepID=B8RJE8_CULTA
MKPTIELLLALSLAGFALAWTEEKPVEEDFCDAEWDGKVEYKEEGETDQPEEEEQDQEESTTAEPAAEEGGEEKKVDDEGTESPEEEGSTEEGKEPGEGEEPRGKEKRPGEKASKDEEKADPRNTYDKAAGLVRAAANVDDIQDGYLKGSLNNRLQEHIRNPIIGAAGKFGNFKKVKIEPCFKTMNQDLKKEIDASKKEFADCKKKTDSSHECMVKMEPGFAAHVKTIGEKIVQCMNKSK